MKQPISIKNEQGIAMLLEVLLIALVLTAAGAAVYTVNNHSKVASHSANSTVPTPVPADGNTEHTAAALMQESTIDDASVNEQEDGTVVNAEAADHEEGDMNVSGGSDEVHE